MLIVMGPVVGVPVTDLFAAAVLPGLVLAGFFIASYCLRCCLNPALGPALPEHMRPKSLGPAILDLIIGVLPVTARHPATLGSILVGLATPTDAAAGAAVATFLLTVGSGRMSGSKIRTAMCRRWNCSSMILLLVTASNLFGRSSRDLAVPPTWRRCLPIWLCR